MKCSICGSAYGELIDHTYYWDRDEAEHWKKCEVCGFIDVTSKKPHQFVLDEVSGIESCSCGLKKPAPPVEGGVEPSYIDKTPSGELYFSKENNTVKVSYYELKNQYRATQFEWRIDDLPFEAGRNRTSIEFEAPEKRNYRVMCIIRNDYACSSCSISITGGEPW